MEIMNGEKNEELFIVLLTHLYCIAYTSFFRVIKTIYISS